jgi:hypothetical protein
LGVKPSEDLTSTVSLLDEVNVDGLDSDLMEMLSKIIPLLRELVVAAILEEDKLPKLFSTYIQLLTQYLNFAGLNGLIASRTTTYLVQLYRITAKRVQTADPSNLVNAVRVGLEQLSPEFLSFFGINRPILSNSSLRSPAVSFLPQRVRDRGGVPTHVRVENNGPFASISALLAQHIVEENHNMFSWVQGMPITSSRLRFLVNKCASKLKVLLLTLGDRQLEIDHLAPRLLVQDTQRILKIARSTSDPKLLEGALVALYSAKFLNLAGPHLTLKLMASARSKLSIVQKLFSTPKRDLKDLNVITESAKLNITNPAEFQVGTAIAAAGFLSEHLPVRQAPLITLEEELGLKMQHRTELNATHP